MGASNFNIRYKKETIPVEHVCYDLALHLEGPVMGIELAAALGLAHAG